MIQCLEEQTWRVISQVAIEMLYFLRVLSLNIIHRVRNQVRSKDARSEGEGDGKRDGGG